MKVAITSVGIAIMLILAASLPALAQQNGTITITMTGLNEISVILDKTQWPLSTVASDTEYLTSPQIEWCTMTIQGTCNVNTFIAGDDAEWASNPTGYKWTLSNDGTNGEHVYGLCFRISGDTARGYVPITKTQSEFWPYSGGSSLAPGDNKQFGLMLLTPTYFYSSRQMQTQILISAVAA
jgi:redox-regulated HSP33 family molecular chaperone